MTAHRANFDLFAAPALLDPGNAGTIAVNRSPCFVPIVSAAAETRTVAAPTRPGAILVINFRTDGGDVTVTVTGGFNLAGSTTFRLTDAGQTAMLVSTYSGASLVWRMVGAIAGEVPTETLTAAGTISAGDSGKTFYINNATGFITTLPLPLAGLRYTFINKLVNTSGNHTIVTNASANIIIGNQNSVFGDAGDFGTADDTISFVATSTAAGDKVELHSDGTSWFAYAISRIAAGMTFTTAS